MTSITHRKSNTSYEYLYELLQMIKKRPGMYLGSCGITRLRSFLEGYSLARLALGLPPTKEEREFHKFANWLQTRFNLQANLGWDKMVLLHSKDEKDAFNHFFTLLSKFCEETDNSRDKVDSKNYFAEITSNQLKLKSEYLYDLLQKIEQTPSMYLGSCSITGLRMFLLGYGMARGKLGLPLTAQEKDFGGFQGWIQEKYQSATSHGWDKIILFHSLEEKDAFKRFFELLEQFRQGASTYSG